MENGPSLLSVLVLRRQLIPVRVVFSQFHYSGAETQVLLEGSCDEAESWK